MKGEHTVIKDWSAERDGDYFALAQKQAEISFQAGIQEGIQEVVEWVEGNSIKGWWGLWQNVRTMDEFNWQTQKEIWGVQGIKKERSIPKD